MAELPDPDRLDEDEPAVDVDEDDNLEVVPPDVRAKRLLDAANWPDQLRVIFTGNVTVTERVYA